MVKVSSSDALAVLRRFNRATDDAVPRHIEQLRLSHPNPTNTLVSFRYNKQSYYLLFDDTAEDDTHYILKQVHQDKTDVQGEVLKNPQDTITTYALPFKGKEVYLFAVQSNKKRLDTVLAERHPETSRSTWQKHIKAGHVQVNGSLKVSSKYDVTDTDTITLEIPDATNFDSFDLPILYLDDNVIVIDKPVGVLTHAKGALNDEFTVAEFFRRYTDVGLETNRPGIVHRLDRDTSGVMIGARNKEAKSLLQKQFADRKTKKTYLAIVKGTPKQHQAKIDLPIGRNPTAPSTFRVDTNGKPAVTEYVVLAETKDYSLVHLRPLTGRTHQLRVHMRYLGTPILGDRIYGSSADRLYLHASKLEITIPKSERKTFIAPVPTAFIEKFPNITL